MGTGATVLAAGQASGLSCSKAKRVVPAGARFSVSPRLRVAVVDCLESLPSALEAFTGRDQSPRWYGTLTLTLPGLKRRAALIKSAVWLWRKWAHQWEGTNSGMTTVR